VHCAGLLKTKRWGVIAAGGEMQVVFLLCIVTCYAATKLSLVSALQDDLAVAAKALGAAVELASGQVPSQPQLEAAESKAAAGGLAAVLVLPAAEAAALQAAVITPEQLLLVLATGDAAPIAAATVVRRAEVAAAAAAAEAAAAAAHSASENMTEAEETEEGDAAGGSEEQLQPVVPVVHTRATRHRGVSRLSSNCIWGFMLGSWLPCLHM
jgi:hypothetical protein